MEDVRIEGGMMEGMEEIGTRIFTSCAPYPLPHG